MLLLHNDFFKRFVNSIFEAWANSKLQLVHASVCKIYSQTVAHFPQAYVLTVSQISTYEAGLAFRRQSYISCEVL